MIAEYVSEVVEQHAASRGGLIAILQAIQARYGYLPADALKAVAEKTGRPLVDIYGVATFYHSFSLQPRGKHVCSVCLGTACHVRGWAVVAEEFERKLGVRPGETTADREFTLETVNCLGACALGPIVVADGHYFSNVSAVGVDDVVERTRAGLDKVEVNGDERIFPLDLSCARCNHSFMDREHPIDGSPSVRVTMAYNGVHGDLRLSSLYGSHNTECEQEIPTDQVAEFYCPHCHAHLTGSSDCPECNTPMVPMIVRGGGIVQICPRRGCKGHILDVAGPVF
jgi:NADH:ubiquinone oxidoreductase subunit E